MIASYIQLGLLVILAFTIYIFLRINHGNLNTKPMLQKYGSLYFYQNVREKYDVYRIMRFPVFLMHRIIFVLSLAYTSEYLFLQILFLNYINLANVFFLWKATYSARYDDFIHKISMSLFHIMLV